MDRFWVFLEALAGFLDDGRSIDQLKEDLAHMEKAKRDRMTGYLSLVINGLPLVKNDPKE